MTAVSSVRAVSAAAAKCRRWCPEDRSFERKPLFKFTWRPAAEIRHRPATRSKNPIGQPFPSTAPVVTGVTVTTTSTSASATSTSTLRFSLPSFVVRSGFDGLTQHDFKVLEPPALIQCITQRVLGFAPLSVGRRRARASTALHPLSRHVQRTRIRATGDVPAPDPLQEGPVAYRACEKPDALAYGHTVSDRRSNCEVGTRGNAKLPASLPGLGREALEAATSPLATPLRP